MAIIIEGYDGSGKSTLAQELSAKLKLFVHHPGPSAKTESGIKHDLDMQTHLYGQNIILDRVTCISEACYWDKLDDQILALARREMYNDDKSIVIYCRPSNRHLVDMSNHQTKDYETEEGIENAIDNMHSIIDAYDELFESTKNPHIRYDYTDNQINMNWFLSELALTQLVPGYRDLLMERLGYDSAFKY